jgi:hypothetical protein
MSELDEAWAVALADAEEKARRAGRRDLADYIALRNSNDLLRKAGIDWLLATFTNLAGEANRSGASIQLSNADGHRFHVGTSTMVGRLLALTNGVRRLSVEAGWPRVPRDGIVRGGGLASARILHLGLKTAGDELLLAKSTAGLPQWTLTNRKGSILHESDIQRHLAILLDLHG